MKCTFPTGIFFSYVLTLSMHPWAYICYLGCNVTSQVKKYYHGNVIQSNCSPSYLLHCIATITPSGSLQPVDLNNARECRSNRSNRLGLCLVCRRSQDQTWQVSFLFFFLSVKCTFPTGFFFPYVFIQCTRKYISATWDATIRDKRKSGLVMNCLSSFHGHSLETIVPITACQSDMKIYGQ